MDHEFTAQFSVVMDGNSWELMRQWRHNERDGVSNHHCLFNRLFRRRSKKTSQLRVTGLCAGNSPVTGKFPAQMASNAESVPIWWRHNGFTVKSIDLPLFAYVNLNKSSNHILFNGGRQQRNIGLCSNFVPQRSHHKSIYFWINNDEIVCGMGYIWLLSG